MHLFLKKSLWILALASPSFCSPLQQPLIQVSCNTEAITVLDNSRLRAVDYGYKGPGVYNIFDTSDYFSLALGDESSGDGVPAVVW